MAQVRRVLGHVAVEIAKGRRKCHRNRTKHVIRKGRPCLVITEPSYQGSKNYCPQCAKEILDRARSDLDRVESELFPDEHTNEIDQAKARH